MEKLTDGQRNAIGKKFEWYINNQSILNSIEFVVWLNENTEQEEERCEHQCDCCFPEGEGIRG